MFKRQTQFSSKPPFLGGALSLALTLVVIASTPALGSAVSLDRDADGSGSYATDANDLYTAYGGDVYALYAKDAYTTYANEVYAPYANDVYTTYAGDVDAAYANDVYVADGDGVRVSEPVAGVLWAASANDVRATSAYVGTEPYVVREARDGSLGLGADAGDDEQFIEARSHGVYTSAAYTSPYAGAFEGIYERDATYASRGPFDATDDRAGAYRTRYELDGNVDTRLADGESYAWRDQGAAFRVYADVYGVYVLRADPVVAASDVSQISSQESIEATKRPSRRPSL